MNKRCAMSNPINCQNQSIPAYSGITINITNPTLNAAPLHQNCPPNCSLHNHQQPNFTVQQSSLSPEGKLNNPNQFGVTNPNAGLLNNEKMLLQTGNTADQVASNEQEQVQNLDRTTTVGEKTTNTTSESNPTKTNNANSQDGIPQAYPPQYYLNNYNYIQNGEKGKEKVVETIPQAVNSNAEQEGFSPELNSQHATQEEDMTSSKEIINELNSRVAEQKELEKNGKKTKVVALTNEYIMSLENYLNNPNTEIRLMAAKEILTRLDEDKERFDDAALNALLNKCYRILKSW